MSWICPWCGTENYREPLNGRDSMMCRACKEDYISPDDLEAQVKAQISDIEEIYKSALNRRQEASDRIASLEDELSSARIKFSDAQSDMNEYGAELKKLQNFKIFREAPDKTVKARLDVHQKTLPLAEVMG